MTRTPEGFLVCHSVPICRTGVQEYLPQELGITDHGDGILNVYREENEVFKPAAIASFEGKPVTDDHPPIGVDASNYASYTKGTVQNVRRGSGADADKLICDLVVYDAALIAKIDAGKREISCGYECKYIERDDGTYEQMDIIGNHVAVVDAGRAGHDVSIRDAKTKPEGGKQMAKKSILHRMFAAFAKDAEPEEVREAARAVDEAEGGGEETPQEAQGKDIAALMNAVEALNAKVDAFVKSQTQDDEPKPEEAPAKETESLDELEEELKGGAPAPTEDEESEEESVTVPPEQLEEDEDLQEQETESESNEARPAADKALALSVIRAMKPIIAAMPQAQQRRASDALSKAVKKAMKTKDSQPMPGGYGALARRKTTDAAAKEKEMRAFGENCRKRNPHCKKEEK
ncbi:PF09979 family protein [Selenomonas sp. FOBRC9]|nr:PF09979 family protein [Selenomonas sp. FOBRC9]